MARSQRNREAGAPAHVVVVGGGISGLAAAWALIESAPNISVTVLESSGQLGGKLAVGLVAGIPMDMGAESIVASRPEAVLLARDIGLESDLVIPTDTSTAIWRAGVSRRIPKGQFMGIPTDLRALTRSRLISASGLLRIPLDRALPGTPTKQDISVGQFVTSRLGREVVDRLVDPLIGGVYSGSADALSMQSTMPAVFRAMQGQRSLLAATGRVVRGGAAQAGARRGAPYRGVVGGVGRLASELATALVARGVQLRVNTPVRLLRRTTRGWLVSAGPASTTESIRADAVLLAVPMDVGSKLLHKVAPTVSQAASRVEHTSAAVVVLAFPRSAIAHEPNAATLLIPSVEGRPTRAIVASDRKWEWIGRAGAAAQLRLIRVTLTTAGRDIAGLPERELVALATRDLSETLGISGPLLDSRVAAWTDCLPQYGVGHRDLVDLIRAGLGEITGLDMCGAAFDGVGVAACIGSAREAADRVMRDLRR